MFYYDGNNDGFESELAKYIALRQGETDKSDYEIGKGWPSYTLADLEKAKGLDGQEYGFDPNCRTDVLREEENLQALMPKFEMMGIRVGEEKIKNYSVEVNAEYNLSENNICEPICYTAEISFEDMEYMKNLGGNINKCIQHAVDQALNEFAYESSPIMSEKPEREFIRGLVESSMEKVDLSAFEVEDIVSGSSIQSDSWSRYELLAALFEAAVLKELFVVRRPKYRHILGWQLF